MRIHLPPPRLSRRAAFLGAVAALALATGLGPIHSAAPVSASSTSDAMEAKILQLVNDARAARGLVPLRLHAGLIDLARDRVAVNASTGILSHTIAGCLRCQIDQRGIQWYSYGEVLAATSRTWGLEAAQSLFDAWKGSPGHWAILMSDKFNYLGIGVAYRSANGMAYGGIDVTESIDQTRPWARMDTARVKGTTVSWTWSGADYLLQTHTAGLKNFDVQYRVDSGAWLTVRPGWAGKTFSMDGRKHGHWYGLRVIARDARGLLSNWTPELKVWVP
jgi:uncharacterized protein YkwD